MSIWNKIINPTTGRKVNINNKLGKFILENYIKQLGGAESTETGANIRYNLYKLVLAVNEINVNDMEKYEQVLIEMIQTVDLPMLQDIQVKHLRDIRLYTIIYIDDNLTEFETTKKHLNDLIDLINSNKVMNKSISEKSIPMWKYKKFAGPDQSSPA
jgi:hypothetical protein